MASWPLQLAEATQWLWDNTAATPLIDALLGDEEKIDLCELIVAKAKAYSHSSGTVFAWRREVGLWIESCMSPERLANYVPQFPHTPD